MSTYAPISFIASNFRDYKNNWLKAYEPGTTTAKALSLDSDGSTLVAKLELNKDGFIITAGQALVIPYLNGAYDLWLFPTEAEADANDTSNALRLADDIIGVLPDNAIETLLINDLSQTYIFDTAAEFKASLIEFPDGKTIHLNDRDADFTKITGTGTANTFNTIASTSVNQSIDLDVSGGVFVTQWGAIGDNDNGLGTDNTLAFNAVRDYLVSIGGGTAYIDEGNFGLSDFTISDRNVVFEGTDTGNKYGTVESSTTLSNIIGVRFVARLKGSNGVILSGACEGSGFRNLQIKENSVDTSDYGLFIDSGATIFENASVIGFNYGTVIADQANANLFRNCQFMLATKVNFLVNEPQANSFIHPAVTDITTISNTTLIMENCRIRRAGGGSGGGVDGAGFGMILRALVGASFKDCVIESNKQSGIYFYRPSAAALRLLKFDNVWCENNYEDYVAGDLTYSILTNRALLESAGTPITWTSLDDAGYQMSVDSQSRTAGGGLDGSIFTLCQYSSNNAGQKGINFQSCNRLQFIKPIFGGTGDTPNLVKAGSGADSIYWENPIPSSGTGLVTSITDNFGANAGNNPVYMIQGTATGADPETLGTLLPILGTHGGPLYFEEELGLSDPRRVDPRCLDDYRELNDAGIVINLATNTGNSFTIDTVVWEAITKIGRQVNMTGTYNVTATATDAASTFLAVELLTYASPIAGQHGGMVTVEDTGAGTIVNDGMGFFRFTSGNRVITNVAVFGALSIGDTFTIRVNLSYQTFT